ncbi:MAG TPA: polynucleotide adenylyltransferase PcnB, partial [Chromatiaceae bacterium]|nr:polynucleotide adenylyltransferase PcnB [Chromatiaceae bacterium]
GAGQLRMIGEPDARYQEDPVRMLRAIRFATKLGFRIEQQTESPIFELAGLLEQIPAARLYEEMLKLLMSGVAEQTLEQLRHYNLLAPLFPQTSKALDADESGVAQSFIQLAMRNTDARIQEEKPVTPAFLFAALLWEPVRLKAQALRDQGKSWIESLQLAGDLVVREQVQRVSIPRRFSMPMRDIWTMQARLDRRNGKRAFRLMEHKKFRAAYDFLLLRTEVGECGPELADWWTEFQSADENKSRTMAADVGGGKRRRRRRKPNPNQA